MKKIVVRSVALLSVIGSGLSFAQDKVEEPKKDEAKKEEVKVEAPKKEEAPVVKTVVPYGLVQSYLNLADSERQNTPDFKVTVARFGLKASEGIARAQVEAGLTGNAEKNPNTILVRRADLGLALPSDTTVSLGRVRIGGSDSWGPDAATGPSGYGPTDGLMVSQKIVVSEGNDVTVSAAYGNSLNLGNGQAAGSGVFFNSASSQQEKGMIVGVKASVEGVKASVFYGMEKSQMRAGIEIKEIVEVKDPVSGLVTTKGVAASKVDNVADVSHLEASLGYAQDHIGGGVWFEQTTISKVKSVTSKVGGKLTIGADVANGTGDAKFVNQKSTATLVGFGFAGDSMQFGMGDLLQKGDVLTYGASYTMTNVRKGGGVVADEKKADVSTVGIGAGYTVGGLALELNVAMASTADNTFANSKAEASKSKSSTNVYLVGAYGF